MKRTTHASGFERFFKNDQGQWAVIQLPNTLLWVWLLLTAIGYFVQDVTLVRHIDTVRSAVLFAWSYLELTQGDSPFRRVFGGVVLVVTLVLMLG